VGIGEGIWWGTDGVMIVMDGFVGDGLRGGDLGVRDVG